MILNHNVNDSKDYATLIMYVKYLISIFDNKQNITRKCILPFMRSKTRIIIHLL